MPTMECQCHCGSNCVCRQARAHPPTCFRFCFWNVSFAKGPREQTCPCEVPTAAECNLAQWFHTRGQENNSRGGGRARCRQQQLNSKVRTRAAKAARLERKFRAAGLLQQSTGREVKKRVPRAVVKWFRNCVLHRVQTRGWRKRGDRSATVPHCCGDDLFTLNSQFFFLHVAQQHVWTHFWRPLFDHVATT